MKPSLTFFLSCEFHVPMNGCQLHNFRTLTPLQVYTPRYHEFHYHTHLDFDFSRRCRGNDRNTLTTSDIDHSSNIKQTRDNFQRVVLAGRDLQQQEYRIKLVFILCFYELYSIVIFLHRTQRHALRITRLHHNWSSRDAPHRRNAATQSSK